MSIVSLEDVSKRYDNHSALNKLNLCLSKGDILGFVGPNGAGKTTTIRLLLNLINPTEGQILIFGTKVDHSKPAQVLRKRIGFLLDNPGHFIYATAKRNLEYYAKMYGIKNSQQKVELLLKQYGLLEVKHKRVETFSKGMKQKLALARAFINQPELLILDEPSNGLDPTAQDMLKKTISEYVNENKATVLFSSHNLSDVEDICTHVAILNKGKLVVHEKIETIRNKSHSPQFVLQIENFAGSVIDALNEFEFIQSVSLNDQQLTVTLNDRDNMTELLQVLIEQGIRINQVQELELSLSDIYGQEILKNQ